MTGLARLLLGLGMALAEPSGPPIAGPYGFPSHRVYVAFQNGASQEALTAEGFLIDAVVDGGAVVYGDDNTLRRLSRLGLRYQVLETQPTPAATSAEKILGIYHDYEGVTALLMAFADSAPDITRLQSIGQSVQGREIWALLITDNPDLEEDEPEVRYASTMHGDEPVGTELLLYLIDRLLSDYGVDGDITALVNETEIWILPLLNPDGLELNQRFNAQGFDLNRSYPVFGSDFIGTIFSNGTFDTAGRPPETQRLMEWAAANSFALAANLHTGALVVNYPYDYEPGIPSGTPAPSPDEDLFAFIALEYSMQNPPMFASRLFQNGITNGSDWFAIQGGLQDWSYRFLGTPEVTIELSDNKRPLEALLPTFWENNEEALLTYLAGVHRGIRGVVTDRLTGAPVYARMRMATNPQPVFTDPDVGDYHRLLLPGTYSIYVDAPGYVTRVVEDIVVQEGPAKRVDVMLHDGDINEDGIVDSVDLQTLVNHLLGLPCEFDCDVDGRGVSSTDLQSLLIRLIGG
jgi:hypothetical protein